MGFVCKDGVGDSACARVAPGSPSSFWAGPIAERRGDRGRPLRSRTSGSYGPVAEVEDIIGLAYVLSPLIAIVAVVVLSGATLAPMMIAAQLRRSTIRTAALALSAYFVLSALTPLFGVFPVPLVGIAMSPVIGFWLGVGLLVASASWKDTADDISGA